jgi:hypothetical protein
MTKIKDIISINSQAVLSNAIQLAWYYDPTQKSENDRLVSGYVFGNGVNRHIGNHTEISSLPVFERIRDAFGNPSASNIFTIIANYGHGKSHFALVLANYFGLAPNSPVLEEIINHIETCSNKVTADQFRFFKGQTKKSQLVVTLAGDQFQDLRQGFLRALRRALDAHEATRNRPIKSIYAKAVEWLRSLERESLRHADAYLGNKYQTDVDTLTAALENFESDKEFIVKDLSRELNKIEANFGADVNLKEIIKDTVNELCTGADAPFHKMLILFDELGIYTQLWCHNPMAAGNFAPQEIFNACSELQGKLCFVGFVQRDLNSFVQGYSIQVQNEFKKWAGRMLPESTYHLVSNLEEVIGKLIIKKDKWKSVIFDNSPQITEESSMVWETIQRYKETWEPNNFFLTVGRDCYPLHPFTTGLLCGFDFTQGSRTIIGAVNSMLSTAEESQVNISGRLKWIRPIELIKEFEIDFKKDSSEYSSYEYAVNALSRDAEPILFEVLQALFLYKEGKINKQNKYDQALLLAHLAAYTEVETRAALDKLKDDYDAIRYSVKKREYEFTGVGTSRIVVLDLARREITGKQVDSLVKYLEKLKAFENLTLHDSQARDFKFDFAFEGDEWYLAPRFLDASKLDPEPIKKLCIETINEGEARGTVVFLLSANSVELEEARERAEGLLDELRKENFTHPLVIAVPKDAATQIERQILIKDCLVNGMSTPSKVQFGDSHRAALEYVNKELTDHLIAHIRTAEFVVPSDLRLKIGPKDKNLDEIADALFADIYKFRPPANSNVMKPSGAKGNTATAEIARQLIVNELNFDGLNSEKQNVVKQVLIEGTNKWGILDTGYKIRDPKNTRVAQAWSLLRKSVSENEWTTFAGLLQKLIMPPYGYDDYTTTFLIAAWIGKHKHELGFKDNRKQAAMVNQNTLNQANLTPVDLQNNLNKSKDFIKWLRSNVSVQHSGRANKRRAEEFLERLQTVQDINEGNQLLEQVNSILQTLAPNDELIPQIKEQAQELSGRILVADLEKEKLGEYKNAALRATDVVSILRIGESLNTFGVKNQIQSSIAFVETTKYVEERIGVIARQQSEVTLPRIESYDSVQGNLERSRKALHQAGRADLEALFVTALERVKKDYEQLQAEKAEQPLVAEINSIQISGMPLRYYRDRLLRIGEILTGNTSERVNQSADSKRKQLDEQIKTLLDWTEQLPSRLGRIKEIGLAHQLQQEILRRESFYAETPEAEILSEIQNKLTARIKELEEERQRKEIAEQERLQREREKDVAQSIIAQFAELRDGGKRYECLVELLRVMKDEGLTDKQKRTLRDLLQ